MKKKLTLRIILILYIILCLIVAGLNFGVAPNADEKTKHLIEWLWHFYENGFKFIMIVVAGLLTISLIKTEKRYKERRKNIIGLIIAALVLHVILPLASGIFDMYFFAMPVPFTTTGLQMLDTTSSFYASHQPLWGMTGVMMVVAIFIIYTLVVFIGSLILGRRWQCSRLCLFNGFIAEVFSPVFPMFKRKHPTGYLKAFKYIIFPISWFFVIYWLVRIPLGGKSTTLEELEIMKYLIGELLMMMFLWVAFTGRGYCYYCPLGTTLGFLSKINKQHISTTENQCISCGLCDKTCPMKISIKAAAEQQLPVTDMSCVGCGHCVDKCPTQTLKYQTRFIK